jgi:hypothetical protein
MFELISAGLAAAIAVATTRSVARHAPSGMNASMAAMMAAMGTGLSLGYFAGMVWDLGWATLAGVAAGFAHGLWMGRRYGPMASLEGTGGGVMGGLMGPMLAVMLLYLPLSLVMTGLLMVALQGAFSAAGVYLAAAAAGTIPAGGWLHLVGRVLGAQAAPLSGVQDHYAILGVTPDATTSAIAEAFRRSSRRQGGKEAAAVREAFAVLSDPLRRARYDLARLERLAEEAECCPPETPEGEDDAPLQTRTPARRPGKRPVPAVRAAAGQASVEVRRYALVLGSFLVGSLFLLSALGRALPAAPAGPAAAAGDGGAGSAAAPGSAATASAPPASGAAQEVQQVKVTLRSGQYEPGVIEVKRGVPVKLTLQAIGEPG